MNTARALLIDRPTLRVAILEKEHDVGLHQSSHNSGVIHAGIYYRPGSLKSKLCVHGLHAMYEFCDKHNIPYKKCGKLIVAVHSYELQILNLLYNNALENNSPDVRIVEPPEIRKIEPHCRVSTVTVLSLSLCLCGCNSKLLDLIDECIAFVPGNTRNLFATHWYCRLFGGHEICRGRLSETRWRLVL